MPRYLKTVEQKLKTKLDRLSNNIDLDVTSDRVKVKRRVLFKYSKDRIEYTTTRYFPSKKNDIEQGDYTIVVLLDHDTLNILSNTLFIPPYGAQKIIKIIRSTGTNIDAIVIGGVEDKIDNSTVYVTYSLYNVFVSIDNEERKNRLVKTQHRVAPLLRNSFGLEVTEDVLEERDDSLLLQEISWPRKSRHQTSIS